MQVISIVYKNLLPCLNNPANVELRGRLQTGAVIAGLAMGSTQTALAHSISYPFTARLGIPHGLACSFTLAEIARFNLEADRDRLIPISLGLRCSVGDIPETLNAWFDELDLASAIEKYIDANAADQFGDDLINRSRAANNIREADGAIARTLVKDALARIFKL
jgi:alcohol dehydrogenase